MAKYHISIHILGFLLEQTVLQSCRYDIPASAAQKIGQRPTHTKIPSETATSGMYYGLMLPTSMGISPQFKLGVGWAMQKTMTLAIQPTTVSGYRSKKIFEISKKRETAKTTQIRMRTNQQSKDGNTLPTKWDADWSLKNDGRKHPPSEKDPGFSGTQQQSSSKFVKDWWTIKNNN